ncbi:MAG: hypothetical protein WDM80_15220 [Limisphaerales bacterium]
MLAEIAALQTEAAARTPAQHKIYPSLLDVLREYRGQALRPYAPLVRSGLSLRPEGRVMVDINANVTALLLTNIKQLDGTIINSSAHSVRADVPVESLETIAALADIYAISPAMLPLHNVGTATSEGDVGHQANTARANYGISGAGVKVGVLSDSERFGSISQGNGDLGGVITLPGQDGISTNGDEGEGTAMMEIVHDLAPGAQLYFATGDGGESSMAANIISMATNYGCKVIIDDITYVDESPFHENQAISQAVKKVSDLGVLYFTSAANDGGQNSGTSGTWQGDFKASVATLPQVPGTLHDWGGGNVFNLVTNKNSGSKGVVLFWSDPWGGAASDYNVYVTDAAGHVVYHGDYAQAGSPSDIPFEITAPATNGQYIVVSRVSGPARMIHVSVMRGGLAVSTASATRGHNAPSAVNGFSVAGVVAAGRTNAFGLAGPGGYFYTYSSDGPRQIFYETDGAAVTPGNFTSSGGRTLQKPDITAATGVNASTTFATNSGFHPFYGTSAAAPHAGAIAALLLSYRPDLTPSQVWAAMTNETLIYNTLTARDQGAGIVMADSAMAYLNPTVNFTYPTNGQTIANSSAPQILGYADSPTANLNAVRVAISRNTDGVWYDFVSGNWGTTTFNFARNVLNATGVSAVHHVVWSAQMPALAAGTYTVQSQGVDIFSHASPWTSETFTVVAPPNVTFSPLTNYATIFDFSQLGGTVDEPGAVAFRLDQYDVSGNNDLFWNGSAWITNGNSPAVYLAAKITGGNWSPANGVVLPTRGQTRAGQYLLRVVAMNLAGVSITNEIFVSRSATDTTPPILTLDNILNGAVLNTPSLPGLSGNALDYETSVASVNVYINRFTGNGVLYWNGSAWTATPTALHASYNAQTVVWQVTNSLPSGANLPNGGYQLEIDAANNESPAGNSSLFVSFSVDYHPVYVFTAGSYASGDSSLWNMNWSDPANWNVGSVPTPDARVIINNYSPNNTGLGSLQLYRLDLSGGTLTTAGMLITNLNVSGGALVAGAISLPANGVFNWSGGTLTGTYNVPMGAIANFTGSGDKILSLATFVNNGTVVWNGGNLAASFGSVLTNNSTFVMQSSSIFQNTSGYNGYGYPLPTFVNNGLLQKTVSNGQTVLSPDYGGWAFYQNGTIDIETGALISQNLLYVNGGSVFTGPGETRVDAGTITINGTNTIQSGATVELAGGNWYGNNIFTGPGTFVWSGGIIVETNTITAGAKFSIVGDGAKKIFGQLNNAGSGVWTGTGVVNCSFGSVINNSGTLLIQNDAMFYNNADYNGYGYPLPAFNNYGTLIKTNSSGTTFFHSDYGGVAFNNNGNVDVQSGKLALGGGGTSQNARFKIAAGSEVDLNGGTHNFGSGLNFSGGLTRMLSGILNFTGTNVLTNSATFEIAGGTVNGTNTFTGAGAVNWSGGTIAAIFNLQSNIALNISGTDDKRLYLGAINNAGPVLWTGSGNVAWSFGSTFQNGGSFTVQNDALFYNDATYNGYGYPQPVFINNGNVIKTNSTGTTYLPPDYGGVAFNNNGTVNVQSGILALGGGGASANDSFTVAAGSMIDLTNGAFFFSGNQTLNGAGTNRVSGAVVTFNYSTNTLGGGNTFAIMAGTIIGTNTFAGTGTLNWSGGTISALLNLKSNIALNITGADEKRLYAGTVNSGGPVLWTGSGNVAWSFGSSFQNSGIFTVQNDAMFYNDATYNGYGYSHPVFINNGTFRKNTTAGTTMFPGDYSGVAFNNNGVVDIQSGNLALGGGGVSSNDTFTVVAGSFVEFTNGTYFFDGSLTLNGAGTTRVSGATVTFDNNATTMAGASTFEVAAGTITGTNFVSGAGALKWSGGTIAAMLDLQPNIALNITGANNKLLDLGTINSSGASSWTGTGNINFGFGSTFQNSGTFTVQSDAMVYNDAAYNGYGYPAPVFINTGTFRKNTTSGSTVFAPDNGGVGFDNRGSVDLQTGKLAINSPYTLSGSPLLKLVLGGLTPGTQFSQENFGGSVTLGGNLSVTLSNGFTPTNGQSFAIITYGSETGQFVAPQLPALPKYLAWQVTYGDTAVTLNVLPSTVINDATRLANGHFQFTLSGPAATSAFVQGSTNLLDWTFLRTNSPFTGTLLFDDPQAVGYPRRFYRVLVQP